MLVTNGNISFALFFYEEPERVQRLIAMFSTNLYAGFREEGRGVNSISLKDLQQINIFRIDGEIYIHCT